MLFKTLLQLIIFIILSILINSEYISLQQKHELILNDTCKTGNSIFCSMRDSIKYLLKSFKESPPSYPSYNISDPSINSDKIQFSYNNIDNPNIICDNVVTKEENTTEIDNQNDRYLIQFNNCYVLTRGYISLDFINTKIIENELFFTELIFDSINFSQKKRATKGEVNITFISNEKYNYDKQNEIFGYTIFDLTKSMDQYMSIIYESFQYNIKNKTQIDSTLLTTQIQFLTNTINYFYKNFSSFDVEINDDENKITYIAYNNLEYSSFINIQDKIFIPRIFITFEYALNYNITYNEGNFTVKDFSFTRFAEKEDSFGEIEEKNAEFNSALSEKEANAIWNTIYNDFKVKFEEYKKLSLISIIPDKGSNS